MYSEQGSRGEAVPRGRATPPPNPRLRFSTRRRLIIAFAAVVAASMAAPALQVLALHRMEATFRALEEQERGTALAMQLEDAVHEQYQHLARYVIEGDSECLAETEAARARALHLTHMLTERMPEADAAAWERQIREGTAELALLFQEQPPAPGQHVRTAATTLAHDRSYAVVLLIEKSIHEYFGKLQEATSAFRRDLVAIKQATLRWTVLLLLATTAFATATVLYLSRSVAAPLARLSKGAAAVAGGDLDTRIDIDTPDEFGALASEFNAMTVALKQHQERAVEAEKLAGIGRLAAGVAHELNNPLQVMLGYLSLNRGVADPRLAEQLAATEEEALRCKTIVDGMLELCRPAAQPHDTVDLRELCDDVSGSLRVAAQPNCPHVSVEGAAHAVGDRARLRQVVFNLVKNAAESAGPKGHVNVAVRLCGDVAEVSVSDDGPGLDPQARARVFEPFFTTKPDGTGLGLAVSRAIARAHRGDIEIRSGTDAGAVFTLTLPRSPEARS